MEKHTAISNAYFFKESKGNDPHSGEYTSEIQCYLFFL